MAKKKLKKGKNKVSGLKISRSGYKFVANWSVAKKATDHAAKVYLNGKAVDLNGAKKGKSKDLAKKTKKFKYTVDKDAFWPAKADGVPLTSVKIAISETIKDHSAGPFTPIEYAIKTPGQPKYVKPEMYNSTANVYKYSWDRNEKDDDSIFFTRYYYETILMDHGKSPSGDDWESLKASQKISIINPTTGVQSDNQPSYGTTNDTDLIIVESQASVSASKKRFVRIYAQGLGGQSTAREYDHAFGAAPQITVQPSIVNNVTNQNGSGTTNGAISFTLPSSSTPTDSIELQYAVTNPAVSIEYTEIKGMSGSYTATPTLNLPNNFSSWDTYKTFTGITSSDQISFDFPKVLSDDEALFIRFNSKHDDAVTYGTPTLLNKSSTSNQIFSLTAPRLQSVQANPATHTVSVTIENSTSLTNNKSFVAVYYRSDKNQNVGDPIGIIPYGSTSGTFVVPEWAEGEVPSIGIRTFVATWSPCLSNGQPRTESGKVTRYKIGSVLMASAGIIWESNAVPLPPGSVRAVRHKEGVALVTWEWTWDEADSAEISWSQDIEAWESTTEPSSYVVTNLYSSKRFIQDLSAGTWYFRVRFIKNSENGSIYGTYSDIVECSLSAAPNIPTLVVDNSSNTFAVDDDVTVKWGFESNDGSGQAGAELAEATRTSSGGWTYNVLPDSEVLDATKKTFKPSKYSWAEGSTHFISVRVLSVSGVRSEGWSNPIPINVAKLPVARISGLGGNSSAMRNIQIDISNDDEAEDLITVYALTKLPLTFSVSGAGAGGRTSVVIERTEDFELERPNESNATGYNGEVVANIVVENGSSNTASISIDVDDLVGPLDDTASYALKVTVADVYGQSSDTITQFFSVHWDHQAIEPNVIVTMDADDEIAIIKPIRPTAAQGYLEGDVCDIYRLSADRPQLIGENLDFFTASENDAYVDPYPTIGEFGGYRIVYKTKFGDYKTADNSPAWVDFSPTGDGDEYLPAYNKFAVIINFDEGALELPYNVSISNSWTKDFQLTKYLGGSMEGDWNIGVERSSNANVTIPIEEEHNSVHILRLLADYPGICHVRMPDGSNFYANVEVKDDREEKWVSRLSKVSLDFKKVDAVEDDIILYSKWVEMQEEE